MSNTYNKNNQNINSVRFQSKKISNNNNFKSSYQKNEEFTQLANRAAEIKKQREKNNPNLIAKTPNSTGQLRLSQTPRNQNNLRTNVRNSSYRSVTNLNNVSNRRAQNQKRALSQTQKSQVNKEAINQAQRSYAQRQAKRSTTRKSQKTNNQNRKQQRRVMTT